MEKAYSLYQLRDCNNGIFSYFWGSTRPFLCRSVTPLDSAGQCENSLLGYLKEMVCRFSHSLFTGHIPPQDGLSFGASQLPHKIFLPRSSASNIFDLNRKISLSSSAVDDLLSPQYLRIVGGKSSFTLPSEEILQKVDRAEEHYLSQISSLYAEASSLIQKELRLAEAEGKKLLIIVGENHECHNSLIGELILAFASHHLGIRDILTETYAQSQIDEIIAKKPINLKKSFITYQILLPILLKLGNKFYSVDPLQFKGASETRNLAINNELVNLNSNSHSIFFCGAAHLTHLTNDDLPEVKILQTKYRLLPINTVAKYELENDLPIDMSQWINNHSFHFLNNLGNDLFKVFKAMSKLSAIQKNNKLISILQKLGSSTESFISFNPSIDIIPPPSPSIDIEFSGFIQNFEQSQPFQKQLVNVMYQFYEDCLFIKDEYRGLIAYGDPGTGKTHCSEDIVIKLKEKGKQIIKIDFHSALLSDERYIQLLHKHLYDEDNLEMSNEIISIFEDQWKNVDIFFIDDTNERVSALTSLTRAMMTYAERNKKKILVNSNTHPFETVKTNGDSWNFKGQLRILEVRGEDYRKHQSWHKDLIPTPINLLSNKQWTSEQREILGWIKALKVEQGECGLFIAGSPGIGKTTAIREALKNENVLWLSSDTLNRDSLMTLSQSEIEYLVIEDVNEIRFNSDMEKLLSKLLNGGDQVLNKKNKIVKIIITSNEFSLKDRLKKVIAFDQLSDRMRSRFLKKFKELHLHSKIDFRTPNSAMGIVMALNGNHHSLISKNSKKTYEFSLKEFSLALSNFSTQEQWSKQAQYRDNVKNQAMEADCIIIKWDADPRFRFEGIELPLLLDLMENNNKQLIFKTKNPITFSTALEKLFIDDLMETKDLRSLSRIKRLAIIF